MPNVGGRDRSQPLRQSLASGLEAKVEANLW